MKLAFAVVAVAVFLPCVARAWVDKEDPNTELLKTFDSSVHEVCTAGDVQDATNAKRDIIERDAVKKLKEFEGKQLILTFPIKDVQGGSTPSDAQVLELGAPLNLDVEHYAYRDTYKTHLTKDQILKVNDESVITFSGKIAIQYGEYDRDKTLVAWQTSRRNWISLSLHPLKVQVVIEKSAKNGTGE